MVGSARTPRTVYASRRHAGSPTGARYLNDLSWRAFECANVSALKEPVNLARTGGKRPDVLTQIPQRGGQCIAIGKPIPSPVQSRSSIYLLSADLKARPNKRSAFLLR